MKRIISIIGVVAPFVCIAAVLIGTQSRPGYSSVSDTLSLLAAPDTPNVVVVNALFIVYNALLVAFGIGCVLTAHAKRYREKAAGIFITATGILGIGAISFPQDPIDMPMSATGLTHKSLAISMTLCALLAVMAQSRFDERRGRTRRARFSFAATIFLLSMGIVSTIAIETDWWAGGLLERITLCGFLTWLFVEGLFELR